MSYYSTSPQTRGIRNNNPFNIVISRNKWLGKIKPSRDPKFETFKSMEYGVRAGVLLLRNYVRENNLIYGRCDTIKKILARYAPAVENDTEGYIQFLANSCGVTPDAKITYPSNLFCLLCTRIMYYESQYSVPTEHIYYIINKFKLF